MSITPEQCRAGRGWLQWSQADLAQRANVSVPTIARFELGTTSMGGNNLQAVERVFVDAGIDPTEWKQMAQK